MYKCVWQYIETICPLRVKGNQGLAMVFSPPHHVLCALEQQPCPHFKSPTSCREALPMLHVKKKTLVKRQHFLIFVGLRPLAWEESTQLGNVMEGIYTHNIVYFKIREVEIRLTESIRVLTFQSTIPTKRVGAYTCPPPQVCCQFMSMGFTGVDWVF